jgi:hypothetical protein
MTIRPNDRLANLPPEDRAKLDAWLQTDPYRSVLQLAAAPRPQGLALQTNLRALSRYFNKHIRPKLALAHLTAIAEICPEAAEKAAISMIHAQAAVLAAQPEIDLDTFAFLLKYRRQQVDEKRHNRLNPL